MPIERRAHRSVGTYAAPWYEALTMTSRAAQIIAELKLSPHPERGYFVETYRSSTTVTAPTHSGPRAASTAIYFLVTRELPVTRLHRLLSDEVFHLYEGGPLDVVRLFPDGTGDVARLGLDLASGERPQIVIAAGTWFATKLDPQVDYCLFGCTVAPGFDFQDFEIAEGTELMQRYPEFSDRIVEIL